MATEQTTMPAGEEDIQQLVENLREERRRRRELEDRIDELEAQLTGVENSIANDTSVDRVAWNMLLEHLVPDLEVDDYTAEPHEHLQHVSQVSNAISRHESLLEEEADDDADPWMQIVQAAVNNQDDPDHRAQGSYVSLFVDDVKTATGFSKRYCQELIEDYGEEYEGADWIPHEQASAQNNHNGRRKQLLVDVDVWADQLE
jgi:hypothetical protein